MSPADAFSNVLVAVAWPYANGPLHLGHVAGSLLPPDIYARYQRLRGRRVIMVSGSDMHGTPITVAAEKEGISPEALAARFNELHRRALGALEIHFDLFTSTATANHAATVHEIFRGLKEAGLVERRLMTAPYDPQARRFLPDRYVEGTCPNCKSPDARGDQCDNCGRTLDPQELLEPRSKLTGARPEYRETEHFFLQLSKLEPDLRAWVAEQADRGGWRSTVRNFTENWLREGLKDRALTRDLTYGVPLPADWGEFPDKRIYVWFDAVVGYLSASREWADKAGTPEGWQEFWRQNDQTRAVYFLGKDNIPFHTIIWPALLLGYNKAPGKLGPLALPFDVAANEFLQLKGAKFSKSRGNAFYVLELLQQFDPDAVRYYLCANMPERSDADWTWPEFVAKVNDELVATLGNYANRVLAMCDKNWGGLPPERPGVITADEWARIGKPLEEAIPRALAAVAEALEAREFRKGLRALVGLAAEGNRAVDAMAPWALLKQGETGKDRAGAWLRLHVLALRQLAIGLQPFLPAMSEALWTQLGEARGLGPASLRTASETTHFGEDAWPAAALPTLPATAKLGTIAPLVKKLDRDAVLAEFTPEAGDPPTGAKPEAKPDAKKKPKSEAKKEPAVSDAAPADAKTTIAFDDFAKLDLRVGLVKSVEDHPKADRLYVLKVDLGTEERQILAGLRGAVPREELLGQRVVIVANLAPREIRGLKSEGMVLAAEADGVVSPLRPAKDLPPGAPVR